MKDYIKNVNGKSPMVVLAERIIDGELYYQVKSVNPSNLLQTAGGEFAVMAKNTVKW